MYPYETPETEGRLRRLARGFADYRRRQSDYQRLREMPHSLLEDIGLTRDQVRKAMNSHLF